MNQSSSPNTLTNKVLASIGAVAVESSYLENTLVVMIWHLLSVTQKQGHLITDDMHLKTLSELFKQLALQHLEEKWKVDPENLKVGTDQVTGHDSLCSRITEATRKRNLAIHGFWFDYRRDKHSSELIPLVLKTTKKPKDGSPPKAEDASWLDALAQELRQIRNDLGTFSMLWLAPVKYDPELGTHAFEPPASLGKSPSRPRKATGTARATRSGSTPSGQRKSSRK